MKVSFISFSGRVLEERTVNGEAVSFTTPINQIDKIMIEVSPNELKKGIIQIEKILPNSPLKKAQRYGKDVR